MALELKRGIVAQSSTRVVPWGKGTISITAFQLDGVDSEFTGDSPLDSDAPFRTGDAIVVAGKMNRRGIFKATAVYLSREDITLVESPILLLIIGGWFIIIALVLLWFKLESPYKFRISQLFMEASFMLIGIWAIGAGLVKRTAKRMVETASR